MFGSGQANQGKAPEHAEDRRRTKKGSTKEKNGDAGPGDPYTPAVDELKQDGHALSAHGREMPMNSTKPSSDPEKTTEAYGSTLAGGEPAQNVRPLEVMKNDLKLDYVLDPHGPSTKMFSFAVGPGHLIVKFHEKHPLSEAMARLPTTMNPYKTRFPCDLAKVSPDGLKFVRRCSMQLCFESFAPHLKIEFFPWASWNLAPFLRTKRPLQLSNCHKNR